MICADGLEVVVVLHDAPLFGVTVWKGVGDAGCWEQTIWRVLLSDEVTHRTLSDMELCRTQPYDRAT